MTATSAISRGGWCPFAPARTAGCPCRAGRGSTNGRGTYPSTRCPRSHNPETNYIVTANQRVVGHDYPYYIGLDHAPEFRARRISVRLGELDGASVKDMEGVHAERTSIPARHYLPRLTALKPTDAP